MNERYIPGGYVAVPLTDPPVGCQVFRDPNKCGAIAYSGKRGKRDWYYSFRSEAQMAEYITKWLDGLRKTAEAKQARKAQRAAPHDVKVGDIFRSSWGYDQTNIDYYEVVKLKGTRQAIVREIGKQSEETQSMQGKCVPSPGAFVGEPMVKLIQINGSEPYFKVESFANAYRIKPTMVAGVKVFPADHWTAYA